MTSAITRSASAGGRHAASHGYGLILRPWGSLVEALSSAHGRVRSAPGSCEHCGDIALTSPHPSEVSDMAKKKDKEEHDAEVHASPAAAGQEAGAGPPPKMKRKEYEREMRGLHGELVAMQEWVKATGAKICIVFEGRDTAGKGGTIKRITERVEPAGVPGHRAARADRAREVADVHPALHPALPGRRRGRDLRPQLVQPGGRRAGDGLLHAGADRAVPGAGAGGREGDGRRRDHAAEVLARGQRRGADPAAGEPDQRPAEDLEAVGPWT